MSHDEINRRHAAGEIDDLEARALHSEIVAAEQMEAIREAGEQAGDPNPFLVKYGPEIQADILAGKPHREFPID